jgi:RNA polymerase sigma-B factor
MYGSARPAMLTIMPDDLNVHREYARTRDPRLRREIVEANTGLVRHLAARFTNRGETFDDLVQVGFVGLLGAIERFDPERDRPFSALAVPTIVGELKRHFRDRRWTVRVPRSVRDNYLRVQAAIDTLNQSLGRTPQPSDVAAHTGISEEAVREAIDAGRSFTVVSLDDTPDGQPGPLESRLAQPCTELDSAEARMLATALLERLPHSQRRIVSLRFDRELSQSQIASELGISQMQVSRLLARSLNTMRTTVSVSRHFRS